MSLTQSDLYGKSFISTRESIAWIPSTPVPFEDSDVLVLSSRSTSLGVGGTLLYLDLRLSLPLSSTSEIKWGFAGLRHTLSTAPVRHRWDHTTIDSRGDGMTDEGQIIHREGREIEIGIGINPATGKSETYEEIWRDEPIPTASSYIFVASSPSVEAATAVMAVLGPHALALAQESESGAGDTLRVFHAVRMRQRRHTEAEVVWDTVFSTGRAAQESDLKELVDLVGQGHDYARGVNVSLGRRTWVVWDAGGCRTRGNGGLTKLQRNS